MKMRHDHLFPAICLIFQFYLITTDGFFEEVYIYIYIYIYKFKATKV